MKEDFLLKNLAKLFDYERIFGAYDTDLVVLRENDIDEITFVIDDKTEFEADYNHVCVAEEIDERDFAVLARYLPKIGEALLKCLEHDFPDKKFVVFALIRLHDKAVIRFHQLFEGEKPYYDRSQFVGDPTVRLFEFRSR